MSNSEYNFACDKCPRTFKLVEFYDKHKKVHELKKQHKCDICGFVYGAAKGLEGHVKTHTDEEIATAHLNSNRQKLEAKASGIQPFGADFHFLNPQGVLAQAKLPTSPVKKEEKDDIVDREQLNGKAPSPAGTGNYTIFGKSRNLSSIQLFHSVLQKIREIEIFLYLMSFFASTLHSSEIRGLCST